MRRVLAPRCARPAFGLLGLLSAVTVACGGGPATTGFGSATESTTGSSGPGTSSTGSGTAGTTTGTTADPPTTSAGTQTTEAVSTGSTTMSATPCSSDQDCTDSPDGPQCDLDAQQCVWPCEPGAEVECYSGDEMTKGVGANSSV